MTETVEAVQCDLENVGIVLWPIGRVSPAPKRIDDVDFLEINPRVFDKPNEKAHVYKYRRDERLKCWFLNV